MAPILLFSPSSCSADNSEIMVHTYSILAGVLLMLLLVPSCGPRQPIPDRSPGVSWELAQHRARTLSDIRYEITLTIPEAIDTPILGNETIRFRLDDTSGDLVLDFNQPPKSVRGIQVAGADVVYEVRDGHIIVPGEALQTGENAVTIEFIAGDSSLNRNEEFLYTLFVPDRAHFAIPCFDQPNLKARYTLTLHTPPSWKAVANGPLVEQTVSSSIATYRFVETAPISTYLLAFAAGKFKVETAERSGRQMSMYHRETDTEKVARNRDAVFDLHDTSLSWLETYTGIPYPFGKLDFVLIPSFQYGGMEHPGAIFYRDTGLLHDETATQNQKLDRASVIAHETAHMWFGNLVTMNWFDDVWTKEVFANFMAARIVNPSFPDINHKLRFLLAHYPSAYGVDRTAGANPIRQPLENLNMAGTLYGAIIYQKAPIVMKHLERLVGEAIFRDGLRTYLDTYRYGNATWPDLISILDALSHEDLKAWSRVWVEEPDRPVIRTSMLLDKQRRIHSLKLVQSDPRHRDRVWNQRLSVLLAYPDSVILLPVQLSQAEVTVDAAIGMSSPDYILTNGQGVGYGLFQLDSTSRAYLIKHLPNLPDPLIRGIVWITLREEMLEGDVHPSDLLELGIRALASETDELNISRIVGYMTGAYWQYTKPAGREQLAPRFERLFRDLMEKAPSSTLKSTYFNAFRSVVLTEEGLAFLRAVWKQERTIPYLRFSERDYTSMALELAVRGVPDADDILSAQRDRIKNRDRKAPFEFVMPALSPDRKVRDELFLSFSDEKNRAHEPWVLQALRYLHHPLRASTSEQYILPGLELVEEIQQTGDIFFPKRWLDATLDGHQTASAADTVRRFLDDHSDYSPRLRGKILQSADGLFRAAEMLE